MKNFMLQLAVTLVGDDKSVINNVPELATETVLQNSLNLAYFLAGIVAVIVIIIGGIMYATSAGDSSSVSKAKNMILYSVVGLVVVIIAFAITNFVLVSFA